MKRLLLLLMALPACVLAEGGLPAQPYIYVEGRAKIERPADMVTLSFELSAMETEQAAANKLVQAQANKVFSILKAEGITDKDIIASDLRSEAEHEESEDGRRQGKLIGYRVNRPFAVKVRDVTKFPKLVDQLLALPVHEFTRIDEGLSNSEQMEAQAWDKAVANARERAEKTLKATGGKIESVFAISPVAFPRIQPSIFGSSGGMEMQYHPVVEETAASGASQYKLAPVEISQSVHVIFLISGAK